MRDLPTDQLARDQGCYLDYTEAKRIRAFAKHRCGHDLLQWAYEDWIKPMYSWRRKNGLARFSTAHVWVPKKQSKTFTISILATYTATMRPRANVLLIAGKKEQCQEIWKAIELFRSKSKFLFDRLWPRPDKDRFEDRETKSTITVLSCQGDAISGPNYDLCLAEEFMEWPAHNATQAWHKLKYGGMARPNSLFCSISTANYRKDVIGYERYLECKKLLDGKSQDITLFPLIYELQGKHEDENNWWPALPAVPELISQDYYREQWAAVKDNPVESAGFRTFLLNDFNCGSPRTWLPHGIIEACYESFDFDKQFANTPVSVGWDSAMSYDINSLCFAALRGDCYYLKHLNFYPEDSADKDTKHPYRAWASPKSGCNLHLLSGDTLKMAEVWPMVLAELRKFKILSVAYDPTNMQSYRQKLEEHGFPCMSVDQRNAMKPCFKFLEQMFRERRIRSNLDDLFRHHLDNAVPKVDEHDRLSLVKSANDNRIDLVDSAALALAYWNQRPVDKPPEGMNWVSVVKVKPKPRPLHNQWPTSNDLSL